MQETVRKCTRGNFWVYLFLPPLKRRKWGKCSKNCKCLTGNLIVTKPNLVFYKRQMEKIPIRLPRNAETCLLN